MSTRNSTPSKRKAPRASVAEWLPAVEESTFLQAATEQEDVSLELPDFSLALPGAASADVIEWDGDLFGHRAAENALKAIRATRQESSSPPVKKREQLSDLSSESVHSLEVVESPKPVKKKGKKRAVEEEDDVTLKTDKLVDLLPRAKKRRVKRARQNYAEESDEEEQDFSAPGESPPRKLRASKSRRKRDASSDEERSDDEEAREEARQKRIKHYDELPSLNVELVV